MIGHQVAVFVDAGYLIKGIERIVGKSIYQQNSGFSLKRFSQQIEEERISFCPNSRFLRIYWYDAVERGSSPSNFQIRASEYPNIKLRLGRIQEVEGRPTQKGVDFLLGSDLINLSQHGAISDAIILASDSDFQKAVETAQNFGVRLHLIGIGRDRKEARISGEFYEEADTRSFWGTEKIDKIFNEA